MLLQCEGPKLDPFFNRESDTQIVRLRSGDEQDGHSHVFEFIINGVHYALKVADPFYNECRAYGRLIDCGVNGKVAVRRHNHLDLPAAREEELARRFELYAWNRPKDDSERMISNRQPLRAIVKDLIQDHNPLNEKVLCKLRKYLIKMRKLGVHPQDVRLRNYGGGLLLDSSIAITEPHWVFEAKERWWIRGMKNEEMRNLQLSCWSRRSRRRNVL